ncbi:thiamine/thiamine pyrophosphate ABC transporter permease ThiP [Pseudooceanicola aestuarii]|uniref:thiamine/thiamine pyrophosphate ABC transporter permease ThiP n=1 Tax=Pseudooceanicola aestuarii TaxID=2697319 RepID=UPI0013D69735|nr:thiamine/thiamine pyrophosphate ABC transporter permease ThiP [Pseudooceanicola aestuarii]
MARRPVAIGGRLGVGAALTVALCLLAPLAAILWRAGGGVAPGAADWAALRFTLLQSALSALVSVVLAVPVARALARRRFAGRRALIVLTGAPFILPVVVAVTGLLTVFGRQGVVNDLLGLAGLDPVRIYGLHGVVLAHVFFNMPLAVRMLLQGWQAIPAERFRLAAQLDLPPCQVFRLLEWPMLRAVVPGALAAIFAICLGSFAVALILGGGPRATTVELAIYQAFRFDFDLGRAAMLALVQFAIVATAALVALRVTVADGSGTGLDRAVMRRDAPGGAWRLLDAAVLSVAVVFLSGPLLAVGWRGVGGLDRMPDGLWQAAGNSLVVAVLSALLAAGLALTLAAARRRWVEVLGLMPLALSALVLGTGYFLIANPLIAPSRLALAMTTLVNVLMALPFCLRVIAPALDRVERDHGPLADQLGLRGLARLRWLLLPRMRPALGYGAGLAGALSMGDLGVITLFADPERATLPLFMYRLMGAYQMEAAAGVGLLLLCLSFGLFALFDLGGGRA